MLYQIIQIIVNTTNYNKFTLEYRCCNKIYIKLTRIKLFRDLINGKFEICDDFY